MRINDSNYVQPEYRCCKSSYLALQTCKNNLSIKKKIHQLKRHTHP